MDCLERRYFPAPPVLDPLGRQGLCQKDLNSTPMVQVFGFVPQSRIQNMITRGGFWLQLVLLMSSSSKSLRGQFSKTTKIATVNLCDNTLHK